MPSYSPRRRWTAGLEAPRSAFRNRKVAHSPAEAASRRRRRACRSERMSAPGAGDDVAQPADVAPDNAGAAGPDGDPPAERRLLAAAMARAEGLLARDACLLVVAAAPALVGGEQRGGRGGAAPAGRQPGLPGCGGQPGAAASH